MFYYSLETCLGSDETERRWIQMGGAWEGHEDTRGAEVEETIIRVYCMKITIFNLKRMYPEP